MWISVCLQTPNPCLQLVITDHCYNKLVAKAFFLWNVVGGADNEMRVTLVTENRQIITLMTYVYGNYCSIFLYWTKPLILAVNNTPFKSKALHPAPLPPCPLTGKPGHLMKPSCPTLDLSAKEDGQFITLTTSNLNTLLIFGLRKQSGQQNYNMDFVSWNSWRERSRLFSATMHFIKNNNQKN